MQALIKGELFTANVCGTLDIAKCGELLLSFNTHAKESARAGAKNNLEHIAKFAGCGTARLSAHHGWLTAGLESHLHGYPKADCLKRNRPILTKDCRDRKNRPPLNTA
jgi:hypothetical protein